MRCHPDKEQEKSWRVKVLLVFGSHRAEEMPHRSARSWSSAGPSAEDLVALGGVFFSWEEVIKGNIYGKNLWQKGSAWLNPTPEKVAAA